MTARRCVELADTAMYQAKRLGRNCTVAANSGALVDGDGSAHATAQGGDGSVARLLDAESRAQYLADHDILTGLYNRGRLTDELDRQLDQAATRHRTAAVLLIDVDNFKLVNDSYGHSEGDRLLKVVAEMIRSGIRATDVAARLGSDEFAVILPDTSEGEAVVAANQIRWLLHDRVHGPGVQSSVGICMFGSGVELSPDDVMIGADIALYEAKEQGGDRTEALPRAGRDGPDLGRPDLDGAGGEPVRAVRAADRRARQRHGRPQGTVDPDALRRRRCDPARRVPADRRALRAC